MLTTRQALLFVIHVFHVLYLPNPFFIVEKLRPREDQNFPTFHCQEVAEPTFKSGHCEPVLCYTHLQGGSQVVCVFSSPPAAARVKDKRFLLRELKMRKRPLWGSRTSDPEAPDMPSSESRGPLG